MFSSAEYIRYIYNKCIAQQYGMSEWVGFNVPVNTLQVISEMNLSSQSLELVVTTLPEQPRDRMHK